MLLGTEWLPRIARPGHLYLMGYRGTGKSSLARRIAARIGRPSFDTDRWIESHAHDSIANIFDRVGEAGFRDLESDAVARLALRRPCVVALGGGAVLRQANRTLIRRTGSVVWLTASPSTLWRRISRDEGSTGSRPALTALEGEAEVRVVMESRLEVYQGLADWALSTEHGSLDHLADAIAAWARRIG